MTILSKPAPGVISKGQWTLSYKHHQSFMAMTPGLNSLTLHNKVDWPHPWPATGDS